MSNPCGICTINVRYKALRCTGECRKWYHSKCLNWTDKYFSKLKKDETSSWKCDCCKSNDAPKLDSLTTNNMGNTADKDVYCSGTAGVEIKVKDFEKEDEPDLETSITLAAEVGSALLQENNKLKLNLQNMTFENSKLALKIKELKGVNNATYQDQIEQLEVEKENILKRNNELLETLHQLEQKLEKETLLRNRITKTFEESDREKEETLLKYENLIGKLQKEIKNLKQHNIVPAIDTQQHATNSVKNAQTQTLCVKQAANTSLQEDNIRYKSSKTHYEETGPIQNHLPTLLLELAHIRNRQEQTDQSVQALEEKLNKHCTNTQPITPITIRKQKILADMSAHAKPRSLSRSSGSSRRNHFSVSLQVAKSKTLQNEVENHSVKKPPSTQATQTKPKRSPPMTAKIRKETETVEEFFNNNIDQAKALSQAFKSTANSLPNLPTSPFLELGNKAKHRERLLEKMLL